MLSSDGKPGMNVTIQAVKTESGTYDVAYSWPNESRQYVEEVSEDRLFLLSDIKPGNKA